MIDRFKKVFKDIFKFEKSNQKQKILLGLSGGADSVFLTQLLYEVRDNFDLELIVLHINHQLRGDESYEDEQFVKKFCNDRDIKYFVERIKLLKKTGIEEKAREMRYQIFERICLENDIKYCAVAHTADDNIETILMNIIRGTGMQGLEGIYKARTLSKNGTVILIRPILDFFRNEIEQYLLQNKIKWIYDNSNSSNLFTRNRVRLDLIPILETYNLQFKQHILNLKNIALINNYLAREFVKPYLENIILLFEDENIVIDLRKYIVYNESIKMKILEIILRNKANFWHIKKLYDLLEKNINFKLDLKNKFIAQKKNKKLFIAKKMMKITGGV